MEWKIRITDEGKKGYYKLDPAVRTQVLAGIIKVSKAPLPSPNGYGKPLGHKRGNNLTGFFKIKYKSIGIRVVYTLIIDEAIMNVIVISERNEAECYNLVKKLIKKYGQTLFKDQFDDF